MLFINRCIYRFTKSSSRRRKYDVLHPCRYHGVQKIQHVGNIIMIITGWPGYGVWHRSKSGKMNNRINLFLFKDLLHKSSITKTAFHEFSGYYRFFMAITQIIHNHRINSFFIEIAIAMTADITGASCNKYVHFCSSSKILFAASLSDSQRKSAPSNSLLTAIVFIPQRFPAIISLSLSPTI